MPIPTRNTDTGSLAAIIGSKAATAARHAPLPEHTVMIDEDGALEWPVESGVDSVDDAASTLRMPAPNSDDQAELAHANREVAVQSNPPPRRRGPRGRALAGFGGSLLLTVVAVLVWTRQGDELATSRERAPTVLVPAPSPLPAASVAVAAPPEETRARIPVDVPLAIDPMTLPTEDPAAPPSNEIPAARPNPDVSRTAAPLAAAPCAPPSRKRERIALPKDANERSRNTTSETGKNPNAPIDPLFTNDPGY